MLITASLDERLQAPGRAIRPLGGPHQATIDGKQTNRTEGVEGIQRENTAFLRKAAKGIDLAAGCRQALAPETCALEGKIGGLGEAVAAKRAKLTDDLVTVERHTHDRLRQLQATMDVQNAVGRLVAQFPAVVDEGDSRVFAAVGMRRASERRGAEVGGPKLRIEMLERDHRALSVAKGLRPQSLGASTSFRRLTAVVGLRGGSWVTGGLSARGLANVAVGGWSDDFSFIVGDHRYRCQSSIAQFLSPRVSKLHSIDATINELRLEVEDRDELFGSVLKSAGGSSIAVDSAQRRTFAEICGALWNSELYESVCGQLIDEVTMENIVDRLRFLSTTRCDISAELKFIASHFYDFLCRPDALKPMPFSILYEAIGQGSLRLENEDSLYNFISRGIETNREMHGLLEFLRLEYCSTEIMNDFFGHIFRIF
jgi:hypothetical protein